MTRFATRLNSFAAQADRAWPDHTGKPTLEMMVARAASVPGLTHVDLNFPDHVAEAPRTVRARVNDLGLQVNGLAMRYYTNPAFKLGAFTNSDRAVRQEAIDLTKRGIGHAIYYPKSLHLQPVFADLGYKTGDLPVSERATEEVLSLPIFPELREDEVAAVGAALCEAVA